MSGMTSSRIGTSIQSQNRSAGDMRRAAKDDQADDRRQRRRLPEHRPHSARPMRGEAVGPFDGRVHRLPSFFSRSRTIASRTALCSGVMFRASVR